MVDTEMGTILRATYGSGRASETRKLNYSQTKLAVLPYGDK
jgi:hypothetical protein